MQSVSYSIALFSVIAADIQRMIRDDLNVLADALQNSRHDNGAEQRAELIADAGQCILLRVKAGQLLVWRAANAFTRSSCARVGPSVSSSVVQTSSSSSSSVPWKNSGLETLLVRIHWLSSSTHML